MEKEPQPESMATITMKPEYPPSEYSTSEPPPAYRHRESSAVQIARIVGLTVVAASFIIGSFILASSWVAARSSCHQLEQLDAMLDKELALEGRSYGNDGLIADVEPLPVANAHALRGVPPVSTMMPPKPSTEEHGKTDDALNQAESKIDEDKLQKSEDDSKKSETSNAETNEDTESDSSEDEDELDLVKPMLKLPIQFDLDELAGAFLANNQQKGRMNCMVERRHNDPMDRRFPFNILGAFAPRASHAERIAIICHGGDEPRQMPGGFPDPQSQVFAFPLSGPVRLPLKPQERPSAPMLPPRMAPFVPMDQNRPGPFPLPMPWDSSDEQVGAPQMRIHVQRVIAIPSSHQMAPPQENMSPFAPPPPPQPREQNEQSTVMHQFVPQTAPTQDMDRAEVPVVQRIQVEGGQRMEYPFGLTPEDLQLIHRTAEDAMASQQRREEQQQQVDNDMQEVKTIMNTLAAAAAESEAAQPQEAPQENARAPRTLLLPQDMTHEERPHYMQPRSVRSVDALLKNEKRVKRCACDCA